MERVWLLDWAEVFDSAAIVSLVTSQWLPLAANQFCLTRNQRCLSDCSPVGGAAGYYDHTRVESSGDVHFNGGTKPSELGMKLVTSS